MTCAALRIAMIRKITWAGPDLLSASMAKVACAMQATASMKDGLSLIRR